MSTIEYILYYFTLYILFFLIRHIENNLLITLPLYLTVLSDSLFITSQPYNKHIYNKQQPGVPDTKTNPKGIGEVNEHF